MLQLRKSEDRGLAEHGWLKSRHTFSFADYYDPEHMGFRSLRVINEDRIAGGGGFGAHPHKNMEIISYVVKGALEHQDSMGTTAKIRPGEVQRMSAGSGIVHSEYNAFADAQTHFFQIWIQPQEPGGTPGYAQKSFAAELSSHELVLVASRDGRCGSLDVKQDVDMYIARMLAGDQLEFRLRPGRGAWVQVVNGQLQVHDSTVSTGDALAFANGELLTFRAAGDSEFMLFDLA